MVPLSINHCVAYAPPPLLACGMFQAQAHAMDDARGCITTIDELFCALNSVPSQEEIFLCPDFGHAALEGSDNDSRAMLDFNVYMEVPVLEEESDRYLKVSCYDSMECPTLVRDLSTRIPHKHDRDGKFCPFFIAPEGSFLSIEDGIQMLHRTKQYSEGSSTSPSTKNDHKHMSKDNRIRGNRLAVVSSLKTVSKKTATMSTNLRSSRSVDIGKQHLPHFIERDRLRRRSITVAGAATHQELLDNIVTSVLR